MATSTKLSKGVVILVAIAGQASLSISLSSFLAKARVRNQVGDKCRVSHQTQHLGLEVAAVFGRYHAAHDGDGGKDAEEGAAGDEARADEGAAVAAFAASTSPSKNATTPAAR